MICLLSLFFAFLAISINLVDHSSQYSSYTRVSRGNLSENLVKVLEIPFFLLFILATREFLGSLSLLFRFRSITSSTIKLSTTLSRWPSRGTLGRRCARLSTLNRSCSLGLFSCKLGSLSLFFNLASFFFSLSALLLFFDLEKSGIVIRVWPKRLRRSQLFSH